MQCKSCVSPMVCRPRMDLTYYECERCGGLWFNGGELESMISAKLDALSPRPAGADSPPTASSTSDCPCCGPGVRLVQMTTYATRNVKILGCPVCFGRWLSRDAAERLVDEVCYGGPFGWLKRMMRKRPAA